MPDRRDEFYVGYAPAPPAALRRFLRPRIGMILGTALILALGLAWAQRPPAPAIYEYGVVRGWTGTVLERPYPMLLSSDSGTTRTWLLAGELKRGAAGLVTGHEGRVVRVEAVRIARGEVGMLELHGPPAAHDGAAARPPERDLGQATVTGEIVDSKCWTGAMNPGQGATHRMCAVRCLLGGLPPLLVGEDQDGRSVVALVTVTPGAGSSDAQSPLLRLVGARVRVTGRLRSLGSMLVLEADPTSIRRVQ